MKIAVIGRTRMLLDSARAALRAGHRIMGVWTCRDEAFYECGPDDFRALAEECGAAFRCDLRIAQDLDVLKSWDCDAALSMNWATILPKAVLEMFPQGILNAHAGDLPRYRGNACPNWAILNGEDKIGLCIHQMAPDLDSGPVVCRDYLKLTDETYIGDVYDWLAQAVPQSMVRALDGLQSGALVPQPQPTDPALSLRTYPRRPEDGRIDWSLPAESVARLVRASSAPFDGAFTTLEGGDKLIIRRAAPHVPAGPFLAVPGQVCFALDGDPVVACGQGMLRLTRVENAAGENAAAAILSSLRHRLI